MIDTTPNEARTVACPMISGMAAATGDLEDEQQHDHEHGAAISSALWAPSVVASFSSLPSGASPETCDSTGGSTRSMNARSGGTIVLRSSPSGS